MGSRRHAGLLAVVSGGTIEAQDGILFKEHYILSIYDQYYGVGSVFCRHLVTGCAT